MKQYTKKIQDKNSAQSYNKIQQGYQITDSLMYI